MKDLSEDLMLEFWRQSPPVMIRCFEGADGERHGVTDKDQAALEMFNAIKGLPGFDGKEPLMILTPEKPEAAESTEGQEKQGEVKHG